MRLKATGEFLLPVGASTDASNTGDAGYWIGQIFGAASKIVPTILPLVDDSITTVPVYTQPAATTTYVPVSSTAAKSSNDLEGWTGIALIGGAILLGAVALKSLKKK